MQFSCTRKESWKAIVTLSCYCITFGSKKRKLKILEWCARKMHSREAYCYDDWPIVLKFEKGKELVLCKLRIIEPFEANLQMPIRLCIRLRNNWNIERDKRLLVRNYGLRKNFSIERVLLHDTSRCNREHYAHLILNLESYYNR